MSYNLETRVERLERQQPTNPYEHWTVEELEARLADLRQQSLEMYGVAACNVEESKALYQASLQGEAAFLAAIEQLKLKQAAEAAESSQSTRWSAG